MDSMTPNDSPAVTASPVSGSSTNTTSPSSSCANSVMPTLTGASVVIHSCDSRYRLSSGTSNMIVLAVDKGQRDDPCPLSVSADDDVDPLAGLGVVDGDVAEGDRLRKRRAHRPAGDVADGVAVIVREVVAVPRDAAVDELDADEPLVDALPVDALERVATHELGVEFDREADAGLVRIAWLVFEVEVLPGEQKPHLDTERVARAEPAGRAGVVVDEGVPHRLGLVPG